MNFDAKTKAWILLWCLVIGTGTTACVTAYLGGAKLWVSIVIGVGTGGTNVYHALSDKPADKTEPPKTGQAP